MSHCICVECGVAMKPAENGVVVLELSRGEAICAWHADRWQCPLCNKKIIGGFGRKPVSERGDEYFSATVKKADHSFYHSQMMIQEDVDRQYNNEVIPCQ